MGIGTHMWKLDLLLRMMGRRSEAPDADALARWGGCFGVLPDSGSLDERLAEVAAEVAGRNGPHRLTSLAAAIWRRMVSYPIMKQKEVGRVEGGSLDIIAARRLHSDDWALTAACPCPMVSITALHDLQGLLCLPSAPVPESAEYLVAVLTAEALAVTWYPPSGRVRNRYRFQLALLHHRLVLTSGRKTAGASRKACFDPESVPVGYFGEVKEDDGDSVAVQEKHLSQYLAEMRNPDLRGDWPALVALVGPRGALDGLVRTGLRDERLLWLKFQFDRELHEGVINDNHAARQAVLEYFRRICDYLGSWCKLLPGDIGHGLAKMVKALKPAGDAAEPQIRHVAIVGEHVKTLMEIASKVLAGWLREANVHRWGKATRGKGGSGTQESTLGSTLLARLRSSLLPAVPTSNTPSGQPPTGAANAPSDVKAGGQQ